MMLFECLEGRQLLSSGITVSCGTVYIRGSGARDQIDVDVRYLSGNIVRMDILLNGDRQTIIGENTMLDIHSFASKDIVNVRTHNVNKFVHSEIMDDDDGNPILVTYSLFGAWIDSGSGQDHVFIDNDGGDFYVDGGTGDDVMKVGSTKRRADDRPFMYGDDGNDTMIGSSGDDAMAGGIGNDKIYGRSGQDLLMGDDGDDQLYGEGGNDCLIGDMGADTLYGGDGNDIFVAWALDNEDESLGDVIYGQSGYDTLRLFSDGSAINGGSAFLERIETIHVGV